MEFRRYGIRLASASVAARRVAIATLSGVAMCGAAVADVGRLQLDFDAVVEAIPLVMEAMEINERAEIFVMRSC